jgi:hypothetical protein
LGRFDPYGNYLLKLPEHHVYLDDRNFFSRYMWGERLRQEKESIIEAFSKDWLFFYFSVFIFYSLDNSTNRAS